MKYLGIVFFATCLLLAACSSGTRRQPLAKPVIDYELPPDTVVVRHDTPPRMIHEGQPDYPRLAMEGGFSGWVDLKVFVDREGKPVKARVASTNRPNMGFEEMALKAAYASVFEPARLDDQPVGVWIKYRVTFDPKYGVKRKAINSHNLK